VTNEKLFRETVDKCGMKLQYLAEKMGISYQSLLNKLHGKTEFTVYEVSVFQQITGCSDEIRDAIFYGKNVACEDTVEGGDVVNV
jgi:hypothetical protein